MTTMLILYLGSLYPQHLSIKKGCNISTSHSLMYQTQQDIPIMQTGLCFQGIPHSKWQNIIIYVNTHTHIWLMKPTGYNLSWWWWIYYQMPIEEAEPGGRQNSYLSAWRGLIGNAAREPSKSWLPFISSWMEISTIIYPIMKDIFE